tara:strand:- start:779 stop:1285 length:507 start_codon:yes stop_codon:yes gene_type:complete
VKGKYIVWGSIIGGLSAVGWYIAKQAKLASKLNYEITGYKVISIGTEGARVDLQLTLFNSGKLKLFIKTLKLNLYAEGNFVSTIYAGQGVTIMPNENTDTYVQLLLNPKILLQSAGNVLVNLGENNQGWKNINLRVEGHATVAQGVIPFRLPIKYSFKLSDVTEAMKE